MPAPAHVLLVDDHAVVREGYRRLIERALGNVDIKEAGTVDEAYRMYIASAFDVVVMDVSLPGVSGIEGVRRLTSRFPDARVLMFSMHEEALFAERAMQAGARGYVTKSSAPETLVQAIRDVMEGRVYIAREIARQLALRAIPGVHSPLHVLSRREFEIFRLMAQGLDNEVISATLSISGKTIANYQSLIREKLGISNAAQLVRLAFETGVAGSVARDAARIQAESDPETPDAATDAEGSV